jgi:integrase
MKLKPKMLASLEPGMHADGGGLYLKKESESSASWLLRVTIQGKRTWTGLGSLSLVSLDEARAAALNLRIRARKGEDPLAERREQRRIEQHVASIPTFKAAAKEFHELLVPTLTSATHAYNWMQSLETYVFPKFGSRRVDEIQTKDVLDAITPAWNTVPDTARRLLRRVDAVFEWCQGKGYRDIISNGVTTKQGNPCEGIRYLLPKQKRIQQHHESLPYVDLPEFIKTLRVSNSALSVKLALEFLILTASRTGEVLEAKWDEFNLKEKVWTIPAERMKMSREHRVPLSARCIEILQLAKQFNDSAIVFPGRYEGHPLSNMTLLMALRRMDYDGLTAHGFRATFKTWAEEKTKFDSLVIEASMAHAVKGIERHYLRTTFFDERRKLLEAWAKFATAAPTAKVVRMPQR